MEHGVGNGSREGASSNRNWVLLNLFLDGGVKHVNLKEDKKDSWT